MQYHGKIDSTVGVGVNNLIKKGAILTSKIEDILEYYPQFANKKRIKVVPKKQVCVKEEYKEIYNILNNEEMCFDKIVSQVSYEFLEVVNILSNMELDGIIEKDDNGVYKIK